VANKAESFRDPGEESFFAEDVGGEKYIDEWIARDYPFSDYGGLP
jgi:hypothetical protein